MGFLFTAGYYFLQYSSPASMIAVAMKLVWFFYSYISEATEISNQKLMIMATITEKTTEVLNDLIQINNDRVAGYEIAAKEADSKDVDLISLFNDMASESRQYLTELRRFVQGNGEEPAKGTTFSGKIYRAWMDVKATFTGKDRKAILASCEFGEDAAQKAYKEALEEDLSADVRQLIVDQKSSLKKSHDRIKRLRDMQPA
jgi:uncharacterized protein (TIGR02284 family)